MGSRVKLARHNRDSNWSDHLTSRRQFKQPLANCPIVSMPIQAVEPQRLYRRIAEQIARLIKRGEYKPGDRLPPERDLATMLKVSRPSVREALIALEVEGYVDVRVGSGVYVARPGGARGKAVACGGFRVRLS